jgi:hypothetical protein
MLSAHVDDMLLTSLTASGRGAFCASYMSKPSCYKCLGVKPIGDENLLLRSNSLPLAPFRKAVPSYRTLARRVTFSRVDTTTI